MVWYAFVAGVIAGIILGVSLTELIQKAADCRVRKRLPLDRQLW